MTYSAFDLSLDLEQALRAQKDHYDPVSLAKTAYAIYSDNIPNLDRQVENVLLDLIVMEEGCEFEKPIEWVRSKISELKKRAIAFDKVQLYNCRVCGFMLDCLPWGRFGTTPTEDICPCCGVQFGVMDETPLLARQARQEWLNDGAHWFDLSKKPEHWNLEEQLKMIPEGFK